VARETNIMINLRPVDKNNWVACVKLSLLPEQEGNLAPNVYTIAESKFNAHYQLRAIYKDDEVVGFLAYCYEDDPIDTELYWLFRFMLDKNNQGKGFASLALDLVVEEVISLEGKRLRTMCKPTNTVAEKVYQGFGFEQIGILDDGDILFEIQLDEYDKI